MVTAAARKALKRAERLRLDGMTDAELQAIVDADPDPELCAAIEKLTDVELELAIDCSITRDQIIGIAASRRTTP